MASSTRMRAGISAEMSSLTCSPLFLSNGSILLTRRLNIFMGLHTRGCTSTRDSSILDISRMSLIILSNCSPHLRIISTFSFCIWSSRLSCSKSTAPRIPIIGVRISWLILARNWLLAILAACACSRFFTSSVISVDITTTPLTHPLSCKESMRCMK